MRQRWWFPLMVGICCVLASGWITPRLCWAQADPLTFTPSPIYSPPVEQFVGANAQVLSEVWNLASDGTKRGIDVAWVEDDLFLLRVIEKNPSTSECSIVGTGAWNTADVELPLMNWNAWATASLPVTNGEATITSVSFSLAAGNWVSGGFATSGVALITRFGTSGVDESWSGVVMTPLLVTGSNIGDAISSASAMAGYFNGGIPVTLPGTFQGVPSGPVDGFPSQQACVDSAFNRYAQCMDSCFNIALAVIAVALTAYLAASVACMFGGVVPPAVAMCLYLVDAGYVAALAVIAVNEVACRHSCENDLFDNMRNCGVLLVEH